MMSRSQSFPSDQPTRTAKTSTRTSNMRAELTIILCLLLLGLVPVVAGLVRLVELSTGAEITPANARFFEQPVPVVTHILASIIYAFFGAFQFSSWIRSHFLNWHRRMGRLLVFCGLLVAVSGLWMTFLYELPDHDGSSIRFIRLVVSVAMMGALVMGVLSVMQGESGQHRAWMIRAYAIAMGAGTQVITQVPWILLFGMPGEGARTWLMGAGWVINVVVAEVIIRRSAVQLQLARGSLASGQTEV